MAILGWDWDPWRALRSIEGDLRGWRSATAFPAVNVYESPEAYGLEAELPGVAAQDLELTVEGDVVTISGARKGEELKGAAYHRQERPVGRFARSLRLPARLDAEHVEAHYENGVLTARIAKAPEARARRIAVKTV